MTTKAPAMSVPRDARSIEGSARPDAQTRAQVCMCRGRKLPVFARLESGSRRVSSRSADGGSRLVDPRVQDALSLKDGFLLDGNRTA